MVNLIKWGTGIVLALIAATGYPGIALLMALESACIPIPSEIIMPFGGALAYGLDGYVQLDLWLVGLAGTVGSLLGSLLAYYAGKTLGRQFVLRYGKYVLLSRKHLEKTEEIFEKWGDAAIFFSRMMPVVRTFISLPAGMARMDVKKFSVYTFLGSIPWCYGLAWVGYSMGPNWERIVGAFHEIDIIIIAAAVIFLAWYVWRFRKENLDDGGSTEVDTSPVED